MITVTTLGGKQKLPPNEAMAVPLLKQLSRGGSCDLFVPIKHEDFLNAVAYGLNNGIYNCQNIPVLHYLFGLEPKTQICVDFKQNGRTVEVSWTSVMFLQRCNIKSKFTTLPGCTREYSSPISVLVNCEIPKEIVVDGVDIINLTHCLRGDFIYVVEKDVNHALFKYLEVNFPECEYVFDVDGQKCNDTTFNCPHRLPKCTNCKKLKFCCVCGASKY
jgi:hypothetical protein